MSISLVRSSIAPQCPGAIIHWPGAIVHWLMRWAWLVSLRHPTAEQWDDDGCRRLAFIEIVQSCD